MNISAPPDSRQSPVSGPPLPPNVRLIPTAACLITELATTLGALTPDTLRRTRIVLPTKRLGTWLLSLLSQQRPAFFAPKISNLEQFIEQSAPSEAMAERGLSPLDEELVLADLIRSGEFRHLRLGHEHEVRQLFAEFADWSVGDDVFQQLHETLAEDFTHAEEAMQSLHERIAELERLHGSFMTTLNHHNCLGSSARRAKLSASLANGLRDHQQRSSGRHSSGRDSRSGADLHSDQQDKPSYWDGPTYIVGFTSLAACHQELFQALGSEPNVELWVTEPPELFGPRNPIALLLSYFGGQASDHDIPIGGGGVNSHNASQRFNRDEQQSGMAPAGVISHINLPHPTASQLKKKTKGLQPTTHLAQIRVHRARSPLHEVSEALHLAKKALEAGHPAAQIALLVTSDSSYGKLIRVLSKKMGLRANVAIGTPLPETVLGSWCVGLFDLLSSNESAETILSFLTHPLTFRAVKDTWHQAELSRTRHKSAAAAEADDAADDTAENATDYAPGETAKTALRHYRARVSDSLGSSQVHQSLEAFREHCSDPSVGAIIDLLCHYLTDLRSAGSRSLAVWQKRLADVLNVFDVLDEHALADYLSFEDNESLPSLESTSGSAEQASGGSSSTGLALTGRRGTNPGPANDSPIDRGLERSTADYLAQFMNTLVHVAGLGSSRLSGPEFLRLTREKLLRAEVRSIGEPLAGLQVLSVSEARYVPFRLVIILGCTEGRFPQGLPKDHLLDNSLKSRIGLPGWQLLEAIEDTTFHLLTARLPVIEMFYPQREGNTPTVRSRFIERLLAEKDRSLTEHLREDALTAAFATSKSSLPRDLQSARSPKSVKPRMPPRGNLGESFFETYGPLRQAISATALEALIGCPYRFLLAELGVNDVGLGKQDDPRQEGTYLHRVLEAFFTGRTAGQKLAEPLQWPTMPPVADSTVSINMVSTNTVPNNVESTRSEANMSEASSYEATHKSYEEEIEAYATNRLAELAERLAPAGFRGSPVELQLRFTAWPAFIRHVLKLYRTDTAQGTIEATEAKKSKSQSSAPMQTVRGHREAPLNLAENGSSISLTIGKHSLSVTGTIDAIDTFGPYTLVTDYKRRSTPKTKQVTCGVAPQLLFYAMALDALYKSNTEAAPNAPSGVASLGGGTPLENQIVGYFSVKKGEFIKVAIGAAARQWAVSKDLGGAQTGRLEEATENLRRVWEWRLEEISDGNYRPDLSLCHNCNYSGICRRDDPQFAAIRATAAGLEEDQRLAAYLDGTAAPASSSRKPKKATTHDQP